MQTKGMPLIKPFIAKFFDDRVATATCEHGHQMAFVLRAQKFELLLESGANALLAGFTLEASASFSAALERFFEFAIKVILKHFKMGEALYEEMFKTMSRQSERQTGAFLVLHALIFDCTYKINNKVVEFRNAVIHKGTIPSPEQAHNFCELVYSEIYKISSLLTSHCHMAIKDILRQDFESRVSVVPIDLRIHGAQRTSIFSIEILQNRKNFSDALENYKSFNATLRRASKDIPKLLEVITKDPELSKIIDTTRPKEP